MNVRTQSTGMGNLITRTMRAAAYAAWKATRPTDAAQIEQLMTALPARQRYAQNVSAVIDRWSAARPNDPNAAKARQLINEYHAALSQFNAGVREAAYAAVADGHTTLSVDWPYIGTGARNEFPSDNPPDNATAMGVWPLIVVAVVAIGAVAIVAAYLGSNYIDAGIREKAIKLALDGVIAAGRLDLIPGVIGSGTSSPGGGGSDVAKGFGMVAGIAALGLAVFLFAPSRRRRAT